MPNFIQTQIDLNISIYEMRKEPLLDTRSYVTWLRRMTDKQKEQERKVK